jgi:tRNA (guanine-N7-)-methyltransferase
LCLVGGVSGSFPFPWYRLNSKHQSQPFQAIESDHVQERAHDSLRALASVRAERQLARALQNSNSTHVASNRSPTEGLVYELPSILKRIDLARLFTVAQPLEVELGCGDGSFLLNHAKASPQRNFIGVERLLGRIRKIDRKGRRLGLTNLRGVRIESGYFLEYLLPEHSAETLHIYFPDPWPKLKHRRHRFINERFPVLARRALKPGGMVYLRTDDADYFEQMLRVFAGDAGFQKTGTPQALLELKTDFEVGFNARGIPTLHASYRASG